MKRALILIFALSAALAASIAAAGNYYRELMMLPRASAAAEKYPTGNRVGYWALDGNGVDGWGSNSGILVSCVSTTGVNGVSGKALWFDGTSSEIQLALSTQQLPFSVCLWLNATNDDGSYRMCFGNTGNGDFFGTRKTTIGGSWRVGVNIYPDPVKAEMWFEGTNTASAPSVSYAPGWHHIAIVGDSNGNYYAYWNGLSQLLGWTTLPSGPFTNFIPYGSSTLEYSRIGSGYSTSYRVQGSIDEVLIYSRALSSQEVFQVYQGGLIP